MGSEVSCVFGESLCSYHDTDNSWVDCLYIFDPSKKYKPLDLPSACISCIPLKRPSRENGKLVFHSLHANFTEKQGPEPTISRCEQALSQIRANAKLDPARRREHIPELLAAIGKLRRGTGLKGGAGLGSVLEFERQNYGWKVARVAEKLGISEKDYAAIERGALGPSHAVIQKLVEVFPQLTRDQLKNLRDADGRVPMMSQKVEASQVASLSLEGVDVRLG